MARAPLPKGVFKLSAASASQDFSEATKAFPFGLGRQGVHEVCEAAYGDRTAALGFVAAHLPVRGGPIIAIAQTNPLADHGRWYETGLRIFTRQSPPFLHVTARTAKQVLWATEEALSSGAPGLVIAETDTPDFTASRRLALAAAKTGVPAALLLPHTTQGSTAATVRWRISTQRSAANPYDAGAPGATRWRAIAERIRSAPHHAGAIFDLEFDHETFRLDLVSRLAPDAAQARPSGRLPADISAGKAVRTG